MKQELDFGGREQLYYQIYDFMYQDIVTGKYQVGDLLPAESEMTHFYKVSRATVRKAMDMLAQEGLIEKKRGQGTFVKSLKAKSDDQKIVSFLREHREETLVACKKVLEQKIMGASGEIAEILKIGAGAKTVKIERIRYADEKPMYMETNYLDYRWASEAMERDFSKESLRVFYVNHCHMKLVRAEERIYSALADERTAELLRIKEGDPVFDVKRLSYDEKGVPREYVEACYRGDSYYLAVESAL